MSSEAAATTVFSLRQQEDDPTRKVLRPSANFPPAVRGDYFISHTRDDTAISLWRNEADKLVEEVRKMLTNNFDANLSGKLNLIDDIQRLGIAYHFEEAIELALEQIFHASNMHYDQDLRTTGVLFRLLCGNGYHISCDESNKFRDNKGSFKKSLVGDVRGLLSLYEAAHLRIHGQGILDEAIEFTKSNLQSMVVHLKKPLSNQVLHALDQALHRGLPRLEAYHYISFYQETESHNKVLLKLAKLDFNLLQEVHREELCVTAKWWKQHMDFKTKLPFARDRIEESYFWILGTYFEPEYGSARKFGAKVIAILTVIDDIYDAYGTKEELELFTEVVNRWDTNAMDNLPEYMKSCCRALFSIYSEMEEELAKEGASYRVCYAKEAMKDSVRAYYEESKWLKSADVPSVEEYMKLAIPTCNYHMLTAASLVGMGDIATKEAFDWILNPNQPKVLNASKIIGRLQDDIQTHKFEQQRKHIPSAVECFMNQFGVSEQEAYSELKRQIEDAWKTMNQELLQLNGTVSKHILARILNLTRVIDVMYKHEDIFTNSGGTLKQYISSLLVQPSEI